MMGERATTPNILRERERAIGTDGDSNTEAFFFPNHWGSTVDLQTQSSLYLILRFNIEKTLSKDGHGSKEHK